MVSRYCVFPDLYKTTTTSSLLPHSFSRHLLLSHTSWLPPTSPLFQTMVSPRKRKPNKPAGSRKAAVAVQIRQNIPFNKKEIVTRTQISRKVNNRVLTKSTSVKVPIVPPSPVPLDPLPSDHNDPQPVDKKTRKGPSRSAAVRPYFPHSCSA